MTTEKELYDRVVAVCKAVDGIVEDAFEMNATIELCVFTGTLGAVLTVLTALKDTGPPVPAPGEEPHRLGGKVRGS